MLFLDRMVHGEMMRRILRGRWSGRSGWTCRPGRLPLWVAGIVEGIPGLAEVVVLRTTYPVSDSSLLSASWVEQGISLQTYPYAQPYYYKP